MYMLPRSKRVLVMVGGASGSGKTTFAMDLKRALEPSLHRTEYFHFFALFEKYCVGKGLGKEDILVDWDSLLLEFIREKFGDPKPGVDIWDTHFAFRKNAPPHVAFGKRVLSATANFEPTYAYRHIKEIESLFDVVILIRIYADSNLMFSRIYNEAQLETSNTHPLAAISEEKISESNFMRLFHNTLEGVPKLYLQFINNREGDLLANLKVALRVIDSFMGENSAPLLAVHAKQKAE